MDGLPTWIRASGRTPSLRVLTLMALVAPVPAAAQVERDRPPGTAPAAAVGAVAAGAADSMAAVATAPGAEAVLGSLPAWAGESVLALERRLAADVASDGVGSIAAAVLVGESVIWAAAFGWADREAGTLAGPGTIYRGGSISKSITGLVLLALVDQGVVALDDPVEPYLPELQHLANRAPDHRAIRFRDLAAHTAGLAREPAASHAARGPVREWRRKVINAIPTTEVVAPPGAAYHYSNIGYALLGVALERAAGRPFESLVQELVFDPLGMTSSFLVLPPLERRRLAAGYVNPSPDSIDPRVPRAEHRGRGYKVPNGGVYSTVGDLARLAMAMTGALGDAPLSATTRATALADHSDPAGGTGTGTGPAVGTGTGYGLGFQLQRIGDTVIAGHSGAVAGYAAYLAFDPATRVGVVLLRNYNHGATNLGALATRLIMELAARAPAPEADATP